MFVEDVKYANSHQRCKYTLKLDEYTLFIMKVLFEDSLKYTNKTLCCHKQELTPNTATERNILLTSYGYSDAKNLFLICYGE